MPEGVLCEFMCTCTYMPILLAERHVPDIYNFQACWKSYSFLAKIVCNAGKREKLFGFCSFFLRKNIKGEWLLFVFIAPPGGMPAYFYCMLTLPPPAIFIFFWTVLWSKKLNIQNLDSYLITIRR